MKRYVGQGVAESLGELVKLPREDVEVIAYGLEQVLTNLVTVAITLVMGFLLGLLPETIVVICSLAVMRRLVGGAHCTTPWRCTIASCLTIVAVALATRGIGLVLPAPGWVAVASGWALLTTWIWAPNDSEKKPITDPVRRQILRRKALATELVLAGILFYLAVSPNELYRSLAMAGAGGIGFKGLMVTPLGHRLIGKLDEFLGNIAQLFINRGGEKI